MSKAKGKKTVEKAPPPPPPIIFDEFNDISTSVDSVIILLSCSEEPLFLKALHHLDTFASRGVENVRILYDSGIFDRILPHLDSNHRFVRRFAMRLAAGLFALPEVTDTLRENDRLFGEALKNYVSVNDSVLNEYSARILNDMCAAPNRLKELIDNEEALQSINEHIVTTNDPDVLHQTLELLIKITSCPQGLEAVCSSVNMPFAFLLATTKNDYNRIQECALQILTQMAGCSSVFYTTVFADPLFMEEMFGILENFLWFDMHSATLDLICQTLKHSEVADKFMENCLPRYMAFVSNTMYHKMESLNVLNELAKYPKHQEALHSNGFTKILVDYLEEGEIEPITMGIGLMAHCKEAIDELLEREVVRTLFDLLINPKISLAKKTKVAECLAVLFRQSKKACLQGIECGGMTIVADILSDRQPDEEAMALKTPLIAMLTCLARQRSLRPEIMTCSMAKGLYNTWRMSKNDPTLFADVANCIASYISEEALRHELLIMDSYKLFKHGLDSSCGLVVKNTVDLILACAKYQEMADMFVDKRVLNFLLKHQDDPDRPPNWSPAIEAILAQNLPIKFALYGRLDLADITQEDFYATHKIWRNPRCLYHIFVMGECAPRRPILLCRFDPCKPTVSNVALTSKIDVCKSTESSALRGHRFNTRPYDERLPKYLQILRDALQIANVPRSLRTSQDIRACISVLSDLVCTKICFRSTLSSRSSRIPIASRTSLLSELSCCKDDDRCHRIDDMSPAVAENYEHLRKTKYDCNIIPLGGIEVGGPLERALLFKVLADRIPLATTLRMDKEHHRIAYNEVAVPIYEEMEELCGDLIKLNEERDLVATHIVDLINEPGQLYPIGSQRAEQYLHETVMKI